VAEIKLPALDPDKIRTEFAEIERETEKAYLIKFDDADTHWIPKRACTVYKEKKIIDLAEWKYKEITK